MQDKYRGSALGEYSLIIGLVILGAVLSLTNVGGSISTLLGGANNIYSSGQGSAEKLFALIASPNTAATPGNGSTSTDPNSSFNPLDISSENASTSATNTTSVEGVVQQNSLGCFRVGATLQQMADQATDPALKRYFEDMARSAYYLGGAQGEIDGVPQLTLGQDNGGVDYNKADALTDIIRLQSQLDTLISNPPASISATDYATAKALGQETTTIAQTYIDALDQFISADGTVSRTFGIPLKGDEYYTGTGEPGSSLTLASQFETLGARPTNYTYDDVISYDAMKIQANNVLTTSNVESVLVETTLTDATSLEAQATLQSSSSTSSNSGPGSSSSGSGSSGSSN